MGTGPAYGRDMEDWWLPPLRSVFGGRRLVLAGAKAAAWTEHLALLRAAGVSDVLVVAPGWGAGDRPDVDTVVVETPSGLSLMGQLRHEEAFVADPPPEVRSALDDFDPTGDALVLGSFLNTSPELAGRPFLTHRRPAWVALEDKVVVDAFWDRAGVPRLPSVVADLDDAARAAKSVDRGVGTVWAADAREGFHGGASQTYWVADEESQAAALAGLGPVCDRVRVMPFIEGVPCSIHGIVLPDGVAVLRPVEMVTLRRGRRFVYAGCATWWDPPADIRETMRSVARAVGSQLSVDVDFRGTFTVDGVVDGDGFWPTELNPRFGAGINVIARASGVPVLLLNDLVTAGREIGRPAEMVEAELVELADAHRGGGTWLAGLTVDAQPGTRVLDEGVVVVGDGFVRCVWNPSTAPVGPSTATSACRFWAEADRTLGTNIGPLTPATDLRASPLRR
jgi:hypothetical protein